MLCPLNTPGRSHRFPDGAGTLDTGFFRVGHPCDNSHDSAHNVGEGTNTRPEDAEAKKAQSKIKFFAVLITGVPGNHPA